MSVDNVKTFFEKVEGDKSLQDKLRALAERQRAEREALFADLVTIAAGTGCDFTVDDFIEVLHETREEPSEKELEAFAGSKMMQCGFGDIIIMAPCTCGYTKPCNSMGLA